MSAHTCPSCRRKLPTRLVWTTLVSGQVPHDCPACRKPFRLTYLAKQRVAYLNVMLFLGMGALVSFGFFTSWSFLLDFALAYLGVAAIVVAILPFQARYEKTTTPRH